VKSQGYSFQERKWKLILSDRDIRSRLGISHIQPYPHKAITVDPLPNVNDIQPASLEMHLGNGFKRPVYDKEWIVDPLDPCNLPGWKDEVVGEDYRFKSIIILPGEFLLAHTLETVTLPLDLAARLEGKSSIGRIGLAIHVTAGFIDPGFSGQITFELVNHSSNQILLTPKMKIAQLCFIQMLSEPTEPYGSEKFGNHYQHQQGATIGESVG
jgi:dCTP deaminase